ncbi:3-hydroxyacyl-CoA dehydrogenase NAD-binding domain-containing protein [Segnochrobactrum spirostomi]|uniref:FAD-dependent oxidoreductase n=1 Tax=Segnochrobactrum spirostomi TaxID=2608987 RepID=A0A6A7Y4I2_9HYPH|nr:3-hydroxyacyl-CoA dehydrogenase NAD-binding domain-containing protein [Segnochrobactrum spirostomi]MQT12619.1 FAD-dependent oxidoreductase [Segnochrobactrum spirostomi]
MSAPVVRTEHHGSIAVIVIDNPPINASSHAVRAGLLDAVVAAEHDPDIAGIVIACAGKTFVAGADISEFDRPPQAPLLREVVNRIEASTMPVIAALHGTTLGGGFELALGCHYRVIDAKGVVGLPETTLGLVPGAGGTQRLPRLAGDAAALDLIPTGRRVAAAEALTLGLVDAVADGDLLRFAIDYLAARLEDPLPRASDIALPPIDPTVFAAARASVARRFPGQIAPLKAIEAIEAAHGPFAAGAAFEADTFAALRASPQARALRHVFFAERTAAKIPELGRAEPHPLDHLGVVGGGTMGAGIAVAALLAGLPVVLAERDEAAANAARDRVAGLLAESVSRGKLSAEARDRLLAERFTAAAEYAALGAVDLVIEAAFEDLAVKREIFAALDRTVKPGAVLATNTSYLDVGAIAAATTRPADVIGLHFFSPAHVMKLLEIVVPAGAAPAAVATGFALAKRLGKIAVRAGVCDGFIGNRIFSAYRRVCEAIAEDGAHPADIDAALKAYGYPMGPFEVQDLAGLDIGYAMRRRRDAIRDPRERYVSLADRLFEAGRLGRKSGRGFYLYESGKAVRDASLDDILAEERAAKGIAARTFTPETIARRALLAMVNEGAKILEEGIALRASDIDVVMIAGYGFPRWLGGPMFAADDEGLAAIAAEIDALATEDEFLWQPAALLTARAAEGGGFAG